MKVGICTSLEKAPAAVDAGFDYVELAVSEITSRDPWEISAYKGLPVHACNLFFPGGVKLFPANRVNEDGFNVIEYLGKARQRLSELGVKVAVVGSGNQRRCPADIQFPYQSDALIDTWHGAESPEEILARYMARFKEMPGTTVPAPESLERGETNVGSDCGTFSTVLKKYEVGYTADAFHLLREWDSNGRENGLEIPSETYWAEQLPHAPLHVHLAQLEGRRFPQPGDPMIVGFFDRLTLLGYKGRVSLECNQFEPTDYRQAIANVRSYFE